MSIERALGGGLAPPPPRGHIRKRERVSKEEREEERRSQGERTGRKRDIIPFSQPPTLIAHNNITSFDSKSEVSHLLVTIGEATSFMAQSAY